MKFELFYSDGGHGGPHSSLEDAREYAEKYLRGGKASWVAIVPYDKMTDFDPKKPQATAKTIIHRKDLGGKKASRKTVFKDETGRRVVLRDDEDWDFFDRGDHLVVQHRNQSDTMTHTYYLSREEAQKAGLLKKAGYRGRGGGDPRWMRAKYPGVADDGIPFRKGEEVLYWPATKTFMVGKRAQDAWRKFESEISDEDFYRYASEDVLREQVIRLAYEKPELRHVLLPLLTQQV